MKKALALILGTAFFASAALADDTVLVTAAVADVPVVATTNTDAAIVATAKLDAAVVEQAAALELFGLSSSVTTGLIFATIAVTTFVVTTDGGSPASH